MEVIVNEIKKAAELVTVIVQEDVQPANYHQINGTCGLLTLDDTIIQYTGSGSVRAGIDLLLISENDIKRSGEAVTVNLPPAQIIIVSSDANVFDTELANDFLVCKDNVAIKPESINLIQATVKQAILQAACDKNILEKANTFAKDYVYGLLKGLGFTEITLNTQAVGNCP